MENIEIIGGKIVLHSESQEKIEEKVAFPINTLVVANRDSGAYVWNVGDVTGSKSPFYTYESADDILQAIDDYHLKQNMLNA